MCKNYHASSSIESRQPRKSVSLKLRTKIIFLINESVFCASNIGYWVGENYLQNQTQALYRVKNVSNVCSHSVASEYQAL